MRQAVERVLESQDFILSEPVKKFERELAGYLGAKEAVGVASGSDALLLSLMALGVGSGDAVVAPPLTFFSSVSAITRVGAFPLFADIDPETLLLDPKAVELLLSGGSKEGRKIKAVLPVHLFGRCCPMVELGALARQYDVSIVEDVAQACGTRGGGPTGSVKLAGAFGDAGCFSFFPSKILGAVGDGGLVATNDASLAEKIRVLRFHGQRRKYEHEIVGVNSRLDAIQAAVLSVKLRYIDQWCEERIERARRYERLFNEADLLGHGVIDIPRPSSDHSHVFNYYVIRAERRDDLKRHLESNGVQTEIYYFPPVHLQPCFARLGYRKGDFPNAERVSTQTLGIPIYPELAPEQQDYIVKTIRDFYRSAPRG